MRDAARGLRRVSGRRVLLSPERPTTSAPGAEPSTAAEAEPRLRWQGQDELNLAGIEYVCRPLGQPFDSTSTRFCLHKPRAAVEDYERLLDRLRPETIVEVGVFQGGSTALMAQLAAPRKLVAIDIEPPRPGIEAFVRERDLEDSVSLHWHVDQADREALAAIVADELDGESIDLVVDDASHLLGPTRITFEALFPHVRPGGEFIIEDWAWAHGPVHVWRNRDPLTVLVFELVMAAAHHPELIASVQVDRAWAVVRRGGGEIDPTTFDLRTYCGERGRELLAALHGVAEEDSRPWARRRRR